MAVDHDINRRFRSSRLVRVWAWKRRATMTAVAIAITVIVYFGLALWNTANRLPGLLGDAVAATTEWLGELLEVGGERVFNPVQLNDYYRVSLDGESVLGHAYGVYHATGFQFIEGPGLADNENIVLSHAGYLVQVHLPADGVSFVQTEQGITVRLPAAEYFATSLVIEPSVENNREGLAAIGQAFGDITDIRPARVRMQELVEEQASQDQDLYRLAECMAGRTLANHILPGFFTARAESVPAVTIVTNGGQVVDDADCSGLVTEVGAAAVDLGWLELPVRLDQAGRIADVQLGELTLPRLER